ncbi:MAG: NfeD family protein [Terriglobales bacterium]
MHWDPLALLWAATALTALVIELHTQTVYLLAAAVAFFAGAAVGFAGGGAPWQFVAIGLFCLAGFPTASLVRHHQQRQAPLGAADIGLEVTVLSISPNGLRVSYRGTEWDAVMPEGTAAPGETLRITATKGSTLEVAHKLQPR